MTPNFALSLSFDGIRLLHRVKEGWALAGEVFLDTPDLGAAMKSLRDTANKLEPDGLRTKLLLPNDQIKYIEIDSTRTSLDDIHAAIDGATAVPLGDLVIDFERTGGRTQIAAVARQTLEESESFAKEHGFAPMTFVAVAEPLTFSTEVFFGPTKHARTVLGADVEITRDDSPAVVTPVHVLPGFLTASAPDPTPVVDDIPVDEPDVDAPETEDDAAVEPEAIEAETDDAEVTETAPDDEPELVFRRDRISTPPADSDGDAKPDAPVEQPEQSKSAPTEDEPVFASRSRGLEITSVRRVPDPDPSDTEEPGVTEPTDDSPIGFFTRIASTEPDATPPPKTLTTTPPEQTAAPAIVPVKTSQVDDKPERANPLAPLLAWCKQRKLQPKPEVSKADLAIIGAKGKKPASAVGGKPKHLGLIMTAVLLAVMLIAALWASSRTEGGIAGLFRTQAVADATLVDPVDASTPIIVDAAPADTDTASITADPPGTVLSPADAARIYAATGVWQRAPRLPDGTDAENLDDLVSIATLPAIPTNPQPKGPDLIVAAPDRTILAPPNPISPNRPVQRDARGFILAPPNGTILPTGVWIYGRKPAITPPTRPTDEVVPAAAVPAEDAETPAENDAAETTDETIDAPETPKTAPADATDDDASAPVDTTEDDTIVIAGAPSLTPPLRPGSAAPDSTVADGDLLGNNPELASFRPSTRPDGLVPAPPPEPFADPELAGLRPSVRPADLDTPTEEEVAEDAPEVEDVVPLTPDISSIVASIAAAAPPSQIVAPTRSAIVASPRPGSRPRNFSQVVSSAQTLAARQQSRNAAASTAAAAVPATPAAPVATAPARASGPTAASVAQAATLSNAINLRNMNLVGVYGRPGNRRALIRLSNGRFVKVGVGSSLDGGQVTAIGDSALNFVKRGQTYALQMPSG